MENYDSVYVGLVVFLATALLAVAIAFYCYYRSKRSDGISSERTNISKVCGERPTLSSSLRSNETTTNITEAPKDKVKPLPPTPSSTDINAPNEALQHPAVNFSQDVCTKAFQKLPNLLVGKERPLEKKPIPLAPQKLPVSASVPQKSLPQDTSPFTLELRSQIKKTRRTVLSGQTPNAVSRETEKQDSSSSSDNNTDTEKGGETTLPKREASYVNVPKKSSPYVNANVPDDHSRIQKQDSEEHLYDIFEETWQKDEKEESNPYANIDGLDESQSSFGSESDEEHVYESFDENWRRNEKKDSPLYISPINTDTEENDYPASVIKKMKGKLEEKGPGKISWARV